MTRRQLVELGFSPSQIKRMLGNGRLHRVTQGGYAVGHRALDRRGLLNAALLHVGEGKVAISHLSAARAWQMVPASRDGALHVSVRDRRSLVLPPYVRLHRPRGLTAHEITLHLGLPITTPERTLRDLLPGASVVEITRMLEQMVTSVGRSPDDLHAWGHGLRGVAGKRRLLEALDHVVGPAVLRSELEREFRSLCQSAGLPLPQTNVPIGRWEVDVLFADASVVIELDGYRFHGGRWQFNRDRKKALELAALGYEVVRLTWVQVKHEQAEVSRLLHAILTRRAGRGQGVMR